MATDPLTLNLTRSAYRADLVATQIPRG